MSLLGLAFCEHREEQPFDFGLLLQRNANEPGRPVIEQLGDAGIALFDEASGEADQHPLEGQLIRACR